MRPPAWGQGPPHAPRTGGAARRALLQAAALAPWAAQAAHGSAAAPVVLTLAAFPLVDEIARAALPGFLAQHPGVQVQVLSRQYADHHTAMTTALSTSGQLPDLMALESSYVGRFAQGGGLEDLARAPYEIGRFRDRLVPYAYDQAVARSGAVVAMPTDIGPGTLLYRQDLLARAGLDPAGLSASWEGFIAAGQQLKARTGAALISHAQTVKDILIRSGLQPGEGLYFNQRDEVLVRSLRFVRAFETARTVRRLGLDARLNTWSNEWAQALKSGRLATELSGAWLVGQFSNWVAPQTAGLWRAAPLPGGANAAYGGTFYAMPRRADPARKAMAWALLQWLTLDPARQLAAFKTHDAFPALRATHDDAFFQQPVAFLGGQPARLLWREAASRISAVPVHKQNSFADEVVGSELDNVLLRGKPVTDALADAHQLLLRRARR